MLVGFDTEYGYRRSWRLPNGRLHGDLSTMEPVCACLHFQDGRQVRITDQFERLQDFFQEPGYTFLVHGVHAEYGFCRRVGITFPGEFRDTLLMGVLTAHAMDFQLPGGAYKQAGLGALAARFGVPFRAAEDKDAIRDSIAQLTHLQEYGMPAVLKYCLEDAKALVTLFPRLRDEMNRLAGPNAERNLVELYQAYSLLMADANRKGLRFDGHGWDQLHDTAPRYRDRLSGVLREFGYVHDGVGIGTSAFARLIRNLGLESKWLRTPTGKFSTKEEDLKLAACRHAHPALDAIHKLVSFEAFMGQDIGKIVDADGRIRCSILPLAQRSSRNSTVSPNLMGIPGELRPLLLPDDGCRFKHFDYSQQEPGVAGYLSGDEALMTDFANGDVYVNLGVRLGLISSSMSAIEQRRIRNGVLKALMLAILYGKKTLSISRDLGRPYHEAKVLLTNFRHTYSRLFSWLDRYVLTSLEQGWAQNIIGFRAAFNVRDNSERGHVARSCQNFPIQSSAAACFQLTGVYLGQLGSDIRLPLHDAYLINVPDEPVDLLEEDRRILSATTYANAELFPGLAVKHDCDVLSRFAKDGKENSLEQLLMGLRAQECEAI